MIRIIHARFATSVYDGLSAAEITGVKHYRLETGPGMGEAASAGAASLVVFK